MYWNIKEKKAEESQERYQKQMKNHQLSKTKTVSRNNNKCSIKKNKEKMVLIRRMRKSIGALSEKNASVPKNKDQNLVNNKWKKSDNTIQI